MRENEMKPEDDLQPVEIDEIERVELIVRNIGGEGVLFTEDGKMIGHQIAHMGHYYYMGHGNKRVRMYRATFRVDQMKSDVPNGDK
jgi:hypothetical protein